MRNAAILSLAVLAVSAVASAQTTITLINDNWAIGRDFPAWSVEMVDTTDKHSGTSSLLIDSPLYTGMTGNMAVFINTESTAPYVNPMQTMGTNIGTHPTDFSLTFWAKLSSQGVWKNTGQTYGQMQFNVNILNNMWGNSGTSTGTLQQWGNTSVSPNDNTGILMNADDMWHQYTLSFTAWKNDPATMSLWTTLGCIEIYHQSWNGNGFGDGSGTDILLHVDDFEMFSSSCGQYKYKGDFNDDGVVNDADYTVWADFYDKNPLMAHPTYWPGQGTNGGYNDADYTLWADNYGKLNMATMPEPATLSLLGLGLLGLSRRRRLVSSRQLGENQ